MKHHWGNSGHILSSGDIFSFINLPIFVIVFAILVIHFLFLLDLVFSFIHLVIKNQIKINYSTYFSILSSILFRFFSLLFRIYSDSIFLFLRNIFNTFKSRVYLLNLFSICAITKNPFQTPLSVGYVNTKQWREHIYLKQSFTSRTIYKPTCIKTTWECAHNMQHLHKNSYRQQPFPQTVLSSVF